MAAYTNNGQEFQNILQITNNFTTTEDLVNRLWIHVDQHVYYTDRMLLWQYPRGNEPRNDTEHRHLKNRVFQNFRHKTSQNVTMPVESPLQRCIKSIVSQVSKLSEF